MENGPCKEKLRAYKNVNDCNTINHKTVSNGHQICHMLYFKNKHT